MPTLVRQQTRQQPGLARSTRLALAIVLALFIHGLLIVLLAWALPHWPRGHIKPRLQPIRLTITQAPPKQAQPDSGGDTGAPTPPPYIATQDEQLANKPPDQPAFTSDKDTLAAAEKAATGDKPMPTQDGRELPSFDFDSRPFRVDKVVSSAATSAPVSPKDTKTADKKKLQRPKTKVSTPDSQAKPAATPQPTADNTMLAALQPLPTPMADVSPQPSPDISQSPPPPEDLAMARETVTSPATPSQKTSVGLPRTPGYQPQAIQTKMEGSISNRGRPAVSAIGTPMGRYYKQLSDAIGMLWYHYVEEQADLIRVGSVKIHFVVAADGRVSDVRVVSGKQSDTLALISLSSITGAQIPPMPPDVSATLVNHQLEINYDFSMY